MRLTEMLIDGGVRLEDVQAEYNPTPAPAAPARAQTAAKPAVKYTVKPGDTLSAIAAANDMTTKELLKLNPKLKSDPKYNGGSTIFSGTKITLEPAVKASTLETPVTATGVTTSATTGAATTGVATTGVSTTGVSTTGASTTGVSTTGASTTGASTTGIESDTGLSTILTAILEAINANQGKPTEPAAPTFTGQYTRRKTGGVVEVVSRFSDGSEQVIDSYKDYSARDAVMAMFENTGLGKTFMDSLMASVDQVYADNVAPTDAQILNSIYNSDAYKTRFAANEIIRKRIADGKGQPGDRLLTPAEYVRTEDAYREIMSEAGLPTGFYDQPEDFTKFIAEYSTSVAEITERVNIAKSALQNADVNIKNALKDYYGLTESDMVAYLLDSERAFDVINSRLKYTTAQAREMYTSAEVGGAALRAGMTGIGRGFAEEITKAGKAPEAERAFQNVARTQEDYERLMSLAGRQAGKEDLAREALGLAGGTEVALEARKLASKERARFAQRGAVDRTSLGRRLTTPDV